MGFAYFHEIGILSGVNILTPYQIDIVKGCFFCNGNIISIWYWFFFYQLIMLLEDGNIIYMIFYFLHVFVWVLIIVSMFSVIHERLQNSKTFT